MLRITCPRCQAKLKIKDTAAGKRVACPKCEAKLKIPAARSEPVSERLNAQTDGQLAKPASATALDSAERVPANTPLEGAANDPNMDDPFDISTPDGSGDFGDIDLSDLPSSPVASPLGVNPHAVKPAAAQQSVAVKQTGNKLKSKKAILIASAISSVIGLVVIVSLFFHLFSSAAADISPTELTSTVSADAVSEAPVPEVVALSGEVTVTADASVIVVPFLEPVAVEGGFRADYPTLDMTEDEILHDFGVAVPHALFSQETTGTILKISTLVKLDMGAELNRFQWEADASAEPFERTVIGTSTSGDELEQIGILFNPVFHGATKEAEDRWNAFKENLSSHGNGFITPLQEIGAGKYQYLGYFPFDDGNYYQSNYLDISDTRTIRFEVKSMSRERVEKLHRLMVGAQVKRDAVLGGIPDSVHESLSKFLDEANSLAQADDFAAVFRMIASPEMVLQIDQNPSLQAQLASLPEKEKRQLVETLTERDFETAHFDAEARTVTFLGKKKTVFVNAGDRWYLKD